MCRLNLKQINNNEEMEMARVKIGSNGIEHLIDTIKNEIKAIKKDFVNEVIGLNFKSNSCSEVANKKEATAENYDKHKDIETSNDTSKSNGESTGNDLDPKSFQIEEHNQRDNGGTWCFYTSPVVFQR